MSIPPLSPGTTQAVENLVNLDWRGKAHKIIILFANGNADQSSLTSETQDTLVMLAAAGREQGSGVGVLEFVLSNI